MNTGKDSVAAALIHFYTQLTLPVLPEGFRCIDPSPDGQVVELRNTFFRKYYSDRQPRQLWLGINPGRYGGGTTGINFTGPRQLLEHCGISHSLGSGTELSAGFVYRVVEAAGGAASFFGRCFIGAVSPVGYLKNGLNVNYYDDARLAAGLQAQIVQWITEQHLICGAPRRVLVLGMGKNLAYIQKLNEVHGWFREIVPLPHPRWILQYRRKNTEQYVEEYLRALEG